MYEIAIKIVTLVTFCAASFALCAVVAFEILSSLWF